jgi:hypothetical protein
LWITEQISRPRFVIHCHMQIAARDANIGVACGITHFSQRSPAGQGMAYERVATVVDRQRFEPSGAEHLAGGAEPLSRSDRAELLLKN